MDWFRLCLYFSPGFVTMAWAPLQRDRSGWRLVTFMAILFMVYWSTIQCFPVQCRHAWGLRMVTDKTFYESDEAIEKALVMERNNFYVVGDVKDLSHAVFYPPTKSYKLTGNNNLGADSGLEFKVLLDPTKHWINTTHDRARVGKWVSPLTGGLSLDFLLLRAYCNLHRENDNTVHVYPLKAFGLNPNTLNATAPCPYWSCVMTEANPNGKLPFLIVLALMGTMNYLHYRLNCLPNNAFQTWFGAGKCRMWWAWFWAALLPLWTAMFIKTTYDMELTGFIQFQIDGLQAWYLDFTDTNNSQGQVHQILLVIVWVLAIVAGYYYRVAIIRELGLDQVWCADTMNFGPSAEHPEDHNTFQVCVWRVDVACGGVGDGQARALARGEVDGFAERQDSRTLAVPRGLSWPISAGISELGRYIPMLEKSNDGHSLKTPDGSVPSLSVRLLYGGEEIHSTRVVKPTSSEWRNKGSIYFQENFRMNIDWQPRQTLRIEVRDAKGRATLATLNMDEGSLLHEFDTAKKVGKEMEFHTVPVTQVVRMLEQPPQNDAEDRRQVRQLQELGFSLHRLQGGGAIWLAFSEIATNQSSGMQILCCE